MRAARLRYTPLPPRFAFISPCRGSMVLWVVYRFPATVTGAACQIIDWPGFRAAFPSVQARPAKTLASASR
jgi:hypothetical protein